ncbi:MAG: hypothetical protein M3Z01_07635 [Thermoproteota archaeon]|nr:hypothetical protein [Thermoproteota archaeon]
MISSKYYLDLSIALLLSVMTKHMIERPLILVPGIMESSLAVRKDSEFFGIWPFPSGIPSSDFLDNILSDLGTNIRKSMDDNVSVVTTGLLPGAYDYIMCYHPMGIHAR